MSLMQDITRISVTGSKVNVIRMLNAVICNVGTGNKITVAEDDDNKTINLKIKEEDGRYGLRIGIPDLLDEEAMQDEQLQQKLSDINAKEEKKKALREAVEAGTIKIDELTAEEEEMSGLFGPDEEEMSTKARMIEIVNITAKDCEYTLNLMLYECEGCAYYSDWCDWGDIARLYPCRIVADNELLRNGVSLGLNQTTIWELEGDGVKKTIIRPNDNSSDEIEHTFAPLMQMDAQRYLKFKIRAFEILINDLEYKTKQAKASKEWYQIMEEEGIELPTLYSDLICTEQSGLESVKELHKRCLVLYKYSEAELETIYKLRAKRCQDKNKELADLYNQLVANLHTDIEEVKERQRKMDEDSKAAQGDDEDLPF